ncbi:MAG TPA: hypothetical protein HPP90_14450 [Deltaproteobacteria bacterium]|nr:hypothetical protein [Deltaproteobacteria bacterium]
MIVFFVALFCGLLFSITRKLMGAFVQSSFHGNLGYIGFAVCYYLLGEDGLTRASILAGFMMLMQNFLAVLVLQFFSGNGDIHRTPWFFMKKILGNPVILSAVVGILFSALEIPIGPTIDRSLEILSNMALPLALLVIGYSISFDLIRANIGISFLTGVFKLLLLPGIGLAARLFIPCDSTETVCAGGDPFSLSNRNHHLYHGRRDERIHQPGLFSHFPEHAPFGCDFFLLAQPACVKRFQFTVSGYQLTAPWFPRWNGNQAGSIVNECVTQIGDDSYLFKSYYDTVESRFRNILVKCPGFVSWSKTLAGMTS